MKKDNSIPHPVDVAVGRKIQALRAAKGMTQQTLGTMVGVTFQQMQKYEKGLNRVSASRLAMLADAFGVPIAELFSDVPGHGEGALVSGEEMAVVACLRKMDPTLRQHLIDILHATS